MFTLTLGAGESPSEGLRFLLGVALDFVEPEVVILALCCAFALRSAAANSFFRSDSIPAIRAGTFRFELLRFSRSLILARALSLDGGRP